MMIHIEPLGTDIILPAFMVGFELPLPDSSPDHLANLPPWIVTIDQQAGGMSMTYPSVVGCVLRLEANRDKGIKDLGHLIKGLKYMAEDPKIDLLKRDYTVLARLVASSGGSYSKAQLRDLQNVLSGCMWIPAIDSGIEAFIRCAECDPLSHFANWNMLEARLREEGSRSGSIYALNQEQAYYVECGNLSDLELTDAAPFDAEAMGVLVEHGRRCGATTGPRVFFLWENCD
jgi:hypothetical protein